MYVCLCHAVKETEIAKAVASGCDDLEAIGEALGAGTKCGICRSEVQSIIDSTIQNSLKNINILDFHAKVVAA